MPQLEKQSVETKPARGGRRVGAGRPKGRKNAVTLELETAAREFADDALQALKAVALRGKSESARVAAATALLDRGFGRPRQAIQHSSEDGQPMQVQVWKIGGREIRF
jgi:hypothetical protein